ncbi:hypothetical protein J8J17_23295, partial [Mycobacterium tuberculosis]|nr:hypothetical protein [Mycobacterium tuberculosis]
GDVYKRQIQEMVRDINFVRNRIAHHEPIFRRDANADFARIRSLIALRCPITADWMRRHSTVAAAVRTRPRPGRQP